MPFFVYIPITLTPIPLLDVTLDNFIRPSYYGGIVDLYKRFVKNIKHYDVNSSR